ncbi:MAG TPA: glycosyltransferase [Candidatus Binatia bacterium]|nr:glycosyltransferase [Candidatus Binatia bacterium]
MISVVIPSYNAGRWLAESLDSILGQSLPPGEVVVVDDGSTDDSGTVLAPYRGRVEVVSGEHGGLAAARNLGVRVARGDWIAFQDADDIALPDRLARLQAHVDAKPSAEAVFADGTQLGNGERIVPRARAARVAGRRLGPTDLFEGFPAYYQSALVARDALLAAGPFDTWYRIHPDHDHAFRLFTRAHVTYLDEPVFRYRRHGDNITGDQIGAREELVHTLERVRRDDAAAVAAIGARRLESALARHYFRIARTRLRLGESTAATAAFDRAVALAPLHPAYRWRRWRAGRSS